MASKSVKRTSTTTSISQSASTPSSSGDRSSRHSSSFSSTSGSRHRAPSPARITRVQEKEELQSLNDRLANYIDRVRFLETENSRLMVQVHESEEIVTKEVTNIKTLYESEISEIRKSLDDTANEKARLQLLANRYKSEVDDLANKLHRKERECTDANKRIQSLEAQVADLQARLTDAQNKKDPLEKEVVSLRAERSNLERLLSNCKKQLEEETLQRVDFENRLSSIREEFDLRTKVHQQELNESRVRISTTMEEIDGRVQDEYESKLRDALHQIREEQEDQVRIAKEEIIMLYDSKLHSLMGEAGRSDDIATSLREELRTIKRRTDELQSEVTALRAQNATYEKRIQDLENQLMREQEDFANHLQRKEEDFKRLQQMLDDQTQEYADLLDVKLKLDMEISAYRKLLEGEEARLNMSASSADLSQSTRHVSMMSTPTRGQKRRRTTKATEELTQSKSSSGYAVKVWNKTAIEIHDFDTDNAKYMKLYNNSKKDVPIGGWTITHAAGEDETIYKFHRSVIAKAGQYITVWGSNTDQTHSPPHDLVMKGQKWVLADTMKSVLADPDHTDMAQREMSKSLLRTSASYTASTSGGADETDAVEGDNKEKCSIM